MIESAWYLCGLVKCVTTDQGHNVEVQSAGHSRYTADLGQHESAGRECLLLPLFAPETQHVVPLARSLVISHPGDREVFNPAPGREAVSRRGVQLGKRRCISEPGGAGAKPSWARWFQNASRQRGRRLVEGIVTSQGPL